MLIAKVHTGIHKGVLYGVGPTLIIVSTGINIFALL